MAQIPNSPLLTQVFEEAVDFVPQGPSVYLFGTFEERSEHSDHWRASAIGVRFVRIDEAGPGLVSFDQSINYISVREMDRLKAVLSEYGCGSVYLDITGLAHHVWAPILKAAWELDLDVSAVYVEPRDYRYSSGPTQGEIFDLSDRIEGISPIPGFASLGEPDEAVSYFVPLLGFEGTRLAFLLEHVQPLGEKILPIIGLPGFRPEYPFHAYHGNQISLIESRAWKNMRFARANCPFSLYYALQEIKHDYPDAYLKVAPIGTKPHALGAVLYSLASPSGFELVYDHPRRKVRRTSGAARCLVYPLSGFLRR